MRAAMINISLVAAAATSAAVDFFSYRHFGFTFCGTIPPSSRAPARFLPCTYLRTHRLQAAARAATWRSLARSFSLSSLFPPGCSLPPSFPPAARWKERIVKRGAKNPCPAPLCSALR